MPDNPRIDELRRRVQKDPTSIAFAQLAEECRRAGHLDEAVAVCRAGLERHPGYLSARVTLGRALMQLSQLDGAQAEFERVLRGAPENLAAIRGLAEIFRRRGSLGAALDQYRAALSLARNDPDLEQTVSDLSQEVSAAGPPPLAAPAEPSTPPVRPATPEAERATRTMAALEQWLDAIHVARANRGA